MRTFPAAKEGVFRAFVQKSPLCCFVSALTTSIQHAPKGFPFLLVSSFSLLSDVDSWRYKYRIAGKPIVATRGNH